jgi:hypothetical protein
MSEGRIPDDEHVYRRIPPTMPFFEDPDRITSANFKLDRREGELGLSVYRASQVTAEELLQMPTALPGSRIAFATVGEIRQLKGGDGLPLGLDVYPEDDESNPGHAEIRGPTPGELSRSTSKALQRLFKLI